MKKLKTLNLASAIFAIALIGLAGVSCNDIDDLSGGSDTNNDGKLDHFFDFATTKSVDVNVDYGMNEQTFFEIYDVDPYVYTANSVYKRSDVQPVGIGLTDADGKYSGSMVLPASLQTAYIYTSNIAAPRVLSAKVSGGILNVTADDEVMPAQKAGTRAVTRAISEVPHGFIKIADWNSTTGAIAEGSKAAPLGAEEFETATDLIKAFLKEGVTPTGLIMGDDYKTDLLKNDEAKVTVTYLYGVSSSRGLLAYYTYTGETPSAEKISSLKKGIIFANTRDTRYDNNGVLVRNTSVDIPYINEDGSTTDVWPVNARIGFVLYNEAFASSATSFNLDHPFYSSPCGSREVEKIGNYGFFNCCSTLSYEYPTGKSHILLGFEDWNGGDRDFNDVVIKVTGVYPTVNVTTTGKEITHETKGILAFEDNWPARGDYDMNDVVVRYISTDKFQEKTVIEETNNPISESDTKITTTYYKKAIENKFEITWTGANYRNGFGYEIKLDDDALIEEITIAKDGEEIAGADIVNSGNGKYIIYITDNVKSDLGVDNVFAADMPENVTSVTYTVTIPYKEGVVIDELEYAETGLAPYNPFIFVQGNKQHEVHLIDMAPTDVAAAHCGGLFGQVNGGDSSDGINTFYRSTDYYPFAINLNADGANNSSVWNIDLKAEGNPIYKNYPKFNEWAKTGDSSIKWWVK